MTLLLDTHAVLWWLLDDARLSAAARAAIREPMNEVLVSAACGWEIATKRRLGKLDTGPFDPAGLPSVVREEGWAALPITLEHALEAGGLEGPHRDPFDRMLIAQSRLEGASVVSADPVFGDYGVPVVW